MATNLVTLDEYKLHASINSTDFDDKLDGIIKRVSSLVKSYCGRTFIDNYDKYTLEFIPVVEYTNYGGNYFPKEFPLQEVLSVELSEDGGTTYTVLSSDWYWDRSKDCVAITDQLPNDSPNAYKITYKGGFVKTPEDLKLAVLDLIDFYYKNESTPRKTVNSTTVEYVTDANFPAHIRRVLDLYRVLL